MYGSVELIISANLILIAFIQVFKLDSGKSSFEYAVYIKMGNGVLSSKYYFGNGFVC